MTRISIQICYDVNVLLPRKLEEEDFSFNISIGFIVVRNLAKDLGANDGLCIVSMHSPTRACLFLAC